MSDAKARPELLEGIREDGTVEGCFVETHYQPCETIEPRAGYLCVRSDAGGVDAETRITFAALRRAGFTRMSAPEMVELIAAEMWAIGDETAVQCRGGRPRPWATVPPDLQATYRGYARRIAAKLTEPEPGSLEEADIEAEENCVHGLPPGCPYCGGEREWPPDAGVPKSEVQP